MFKNFEDFLNEAEMPHGNYVAVGGKLDQSGIELNSGKFTKEPHVTLMYSENTSVPFDKVSKVLEKYGDVKAKFKSTELFDERDLPTVAVVLTLECEALHEMHKALKEAGLKHSFDDYHPHMTFAYRVEKEDGKELQATLNSMFKDKTFDLSGWTNTKINKNWADE